MFVIFEGLDKVGKGTLEHEFLKLTDFKHIVIDRGPVGYAVFDKLFGRLTRAGLKEYQKQVEMINESGQFYVIYLRADEAEVASRMRKWNEAFMYDYSEAQELYERLLLTWYHDEILFRLDTTTLSVSEAAKKIVEAFNSKDDPKYIMDNYYHHIYTLDELNERRNEHERKSKEV